MDSSHEGSTSEDATGESKAPKNKIEETKIEKQEETVEAQNNDETGTQTTTDIENPKQETTSRPSVEIEERSHHTAESSEGEAKFTSEYVRNTTDTDIPSDQEHQPDPTISRKKKSVKIEEIHLKEQKKNVENPLIYISPPENSEATSPSPTIKPSKKEDSENDNDTRNEDSLDERRFINGLDILTGLTTEEAVKKLLQVMKETMNELEHHKESKLQILRTYLKEALLGCLAFLLAAFIVEATSLKVIPRIIVEFGLLILCFLVSCFLVFRDRTHKNDIINRARAHIKNFELHGDPYLKLWIDSTIVNSSISTVSVLRDGKWQKIPLNHLVEGDIVGLVHNEIAPVKLKCIEPQFDGNLLEPGQGTDAFHLPDILRVSTPLNKKLKFTKSNRLLALTERCRFIALETPAAQQLRISIKSPKKPQSPVENNIAYTNTICSWILWISLIISAIVDIIRFFLQQQGRTTSQWVNLLLLRQAYLSIPFLHLSLPLLLAFCWAFGNAKILAIFDWIQHKYEKHNPPKHTETHDEWEVDHGDGKLPPKVLDLFMKYFLTILRGNNPTISPSLRLVHELGSITVVCCVDKDGVLSDVNLQAEKIYLHKSEESPNVLELSRISNVGLKFDDRNWSEHIMILKPLGLNCLLNKNCRPLESSKLEVPVHVHRLNCLLEREDPYNVYSRCLCSLGKEIGFTDDALENFIRVKEIHTFFPTIDKHLTKKKTTTPPSSYLLSLVIRDKSSTSLQLLSRGSTDAVLEHCNSFWDGQGIKPLTPEDKAKIIQLSNDWTNTSDCISFSYKPIDKKLHWLFSNEESNEKNPVCIHLKRGDAFEDIISIEGTSVVKTKKKKGSFLSLQELENQSETESVSSDGASKHDSLRQLQKNQIFIGMAAVKEQPKVNLPKSVEVWRHAGIRFVFFSNETYDSSTKSFVGRLGLETDWNCCISLDENDNKQNYLNSNNVVFLPKGIKQIRSHLADDIDNVPLLVPMFSDATPETSTEMLKIFQEYGDVVCCIGSTLNTDNSSVFARSDVAIGIEPPFKLCVNEEEKAEELLPLITSSNFLKLNSSGSLSTDITGLSCPLIMHRKTNIHDLIQLIRSSRHLLINIKQALMFYLLCNSTLEILLLMSYCVLPSYFHILTGVQLTWLVWTIIPTLSLCLLTSRGESDILDSISPKNLKNPDVVRFVVRNLLYRLALTTFVLLGIFLRTFHALYSDDLNSTERWNIIFGSGDQSEDFSLSQDFQSALSSSQTVLMFAFSFHMGVYSLCWAYNKRSIFTKPILIHPIMVVGIFVSLIVQVVWNAVQTAISPPFLLHKLPWEIYVLVFGWPIVLIAVDELIKHGERKWITTYQKELRLEFDTRLGRYSPK